MDFGDLVFITANFYDKDGEPRCYATFAKLKDGELYNFDARVWRKSDKPQPFAICHVTGELRQYGRAVSFVLGTCDVVGQLA